VADDENKPKTYTEKESYTQDELYAVLTACEPRTRTDFIYHCRKAAEEMEKEMESLEDENDKRELSSEIALMRSVQTLATRAEEDVKNLG
jgi:hypothetical protein